MKTIKVIITTLLIVFSLSLSGQTIKYNDASYEVKKGTFFKEGVDVTQTLTEEDKLKILEAVDKKKEEMQAAKIKEKQEKAVEKQQKQEEKAQKQAEKKRQQAEKEKKKAEKALAKREKLKSNYENAEKKHKQAIAKYEKLSEKGKLSPVDKDKWANKIDKLKLKLEKAKSKL